MSFFWYSWTCGIIQRKKQTYGGYLNEGTLHYMWKSEEEYEACETWLINAEKRPFWKGENTPIVKVFSVGIVLETKHGVCADSSEARFG